jgi:hypothetical protein
MIDRISAHFAQQPRLCISMHGEAEFYIFDPVGDFPCQHRGGGAPQETDLTVRNTGPAAVHLVAIDHCLYGSADATRCDCALVRQEEIRFVEFKHGKNKNRPERLRECIPQLAAAINDFVRAGIISPHSTVQAIACVGFAEQWPPRGAAIEARILQLNKLVAAGVVVELHISDSTSFG